MKKNLLKGLMLITAFAFGSSLNAQTYCSVSTLNTGDYVSALSSSGAISDVSYSASSQPAGSYADETSQTFQSYATQTFSMSTTYVGGENGVNIWVDWNNDLTFDATEKVGYQSGTAATNNFTVTVPATAAVGSYRMRVRALYGSSADPLACGQVNWGSTIDFTLELLTPPSCLIPTSLLAANITATTAELSWTENNTSTTWNVEYGAPGFNPGSGTGTPLNGVTTNPYSLTGIAADTDFEFYVQSDCGGGDLSTWSGPYSFTTPPSCLAPTALSISNLTYASVDLSWTENNTSTTWNIEYGAPGFSPGSGTGTPLNSVTTNPYSLTGLTADTGYEFYVQSDCGGGDLSTWSGPYAFYTGYCVPSSTSPLTYIDNFSTSNGSTNISNLASGYSTAGYFDGTTQIVSSFETSSFDFSAEIVGGTVGFAIWIDWNNDFVFDNATEKVFNTTSYGSGPFTGSVSVPLGTPVGNYRMRITTNFNANNPSDACANSTRAEFEDYTLTLVTPPSCLPPMDIDTVSVSTNSIELQWTELNTATSWEIEYGLAGFTLGTGWTTIANTNPYTITNNLNPSAEYDFYVKSNCGGGDLSEWRGPFSMYTDCGIAMAPFYESFNNGALPQCWENTTIGSTSANNMWKFVGTPDYGATANGKAVGTYAWADGSYENDSTMLITPQIDVSQLTTPYLSFEWFSINTNTPGDTHPLIVEVFDGTSWSLLDTLIADNDEWMFVNYDLSAFSNNIIQIRFMLNQTLTSGFAFYTDILLDEVIVDDCSDLGGQDGVFDVCRLDINVDLNDNIIVKPNGGGEWSFPEEPSYLTEDSILNVTYLPVGSYEVFYVERSVCYDTTFATINVFNVTTAGTDGSLSVCRNEPINLFGALSGTVDLGGDWYDHNIILLPNSQPKAENFQGTYNYQYIADNGVCPADTAVVEIVVGSCNYLALGEELFTDISVYPNPATTQLNIVNPSNTSSLKVEMLDMNGRVVLVENKALNNASEATLAIDHLERGIYTLRVYNNEGQKTFKVVKQ